MPSRPLTIATYAAGASLAAITLVYILEPTFSINDDKIYSRKKCAVGLSNPANDCFINSVLQALAGLEHLRNYLLKEDEKHGSSLKLNLNKYAVDSLEKGIITEASKDILDKLNERPAYRKTISAQGFVRALELAFGSRISRQQQDAQEFLQIVAEKLCEGYYARKSARRKACRPRVPKLTDGSDRQLDPKRIPVDEQEKEENEIKRSVQVAGDFGAPEVESKSLAGLTDEDGESEDEDDGKGFPLEGKLESQIECLSCHFRPKPKVSPFITLTLNVPERTSTTLNSCFDGMLKVEHIDDFRCEKCRLYHALQCKGNELFNSTDPILKQLLSKDIFHIEQALSKDPENIPKDISLPSISLAPKTRIARYTRISSFPRTLAIHLSRSLYSSSSTIFTKNTAKVAFPEILQLGGLLDQRQYRLVCVVTHKGGHNSGHYESFRRRFLGEPISNTKSNGAKRPRFTRRTTQTQQPVSMQQNADINSECLERPSSSSSPPSPKPPSFSTIDKAGFSAATSFPADEDIPANTRSSNFKSTRNWSRSSQPPIMADVPRPKKKKQRESHWWRISDEHVKECKTSDVLALQKEVYLLFYDLVGMVNEEL